MVKRSLKELFTAIIMIGLTMSLFSLWGCMPKLSSHQQEPDFDEIASKIMKAFEEDSIDPIEGVLSKSALKTNDLQQGIGYGHKILNGEGIKKIVFRNKVEEDQFKNGKSCKFFSCSYDVFTKENRYCLDFQFFSKNDIYPDDKGLYRVNFETEQDSKLEYEKRQEQLKSGDSTHWNYGATYERAGIYNPEWQTTPPPDDYKGQRY